MDGYTDTRNNLCQRRCLTTQPSNCILQRESSDFCSAAVWGACPLTEWIPSHSWGKMLSKISNYSQFYHKNKCGVLKNKAILMSSARKLYRLIILGNEIQYFVFSSSFCSVMCKQHSRQTRFIWENGPNLHPLVSVPDQPGTFLLHKNVAKCCLKKIFDRNPPDSEDNANHWGRMTEWMNEWIEGWKMKGWIEE